MTTKKMKNRRPFFVISNLHFRFDKNFCKMYTLPA